MKEKETKFENQNLLKEYEVLSTRVEQLSNITWQTASLFLGIAMTGLAVVGQSLFEPAFHVPSIGILVLGLAVIFVISIWNDAANRWNTTIRIFYFRLNELEKKLGILGNTYITKLDDLTKETPTGQIDISKLDQEIRPVAGKYLSTHFSNSIGRFRNQLVIGVSFGWLTLIILDAIIGACRCDSSMISSTNQLVDRLPELANNAWEQLIVLFGICGFGLAVKRLHKVEKLAIVLTFALFLFVAVLGFLSLVEFSRIGFPNLQSNPLILLPMLVSVSMLVSVYVFLKDLVRRNRE